MSAAPASKSASQPPMGRAILLVDHGSVRAAANALLSEVANLVRARTPESHVVVAHMELAEPTIDQAFDACVAAGAREIIVHPYMLAPGRHATADIPRQVQAAAARHPGIRYAVTAPLGLHPLLADVVLARVEAAAAELTPGE